MSRRSSRIAAKRQNKALSFDQYRWQNRIIVTHSNDEQHPDLLKLQRDINGNMRGFKNRHLIHIHQSDPKEDFQIKLIGKDGGTKFQGRNASLLELFNRIDAMPMRRYEMRFDDKDGE